MQRDTQELRAVLYDPGKAIFESHAKLASVFLDGHRLIISNHVLVIVEHQPTHYSTRKKLEDGACVLSYALLSVLGREAQLQKCKDLKEVKEKTKTEFLEIASVPAFKEMVEDLTWLLSVTYDKDSKGQHPSRQDTELNILIDKWHLDPVAPLERLKHAIHYPYKPDRVGWHPWPLLLALKRYFRNQELSAFEFDGNSGLMNCDTSSIDFPLPQSPVRYSSILRFLIGVCISKVTADKPEPLVSCHVTRSGRREPFQRMISVKIEGLTKKDNEGLAKVIYSALSVPRDWRIEDGTSGNFHGPFVRLASEMLGVGGEDSEQTDRWMPVPISELVNNEIMKLKNGNGIFSVSLDQDSLKLKWSHETKPSA